MSITLSSEKITLTIDHPTLGKRVLTNVKAPKITPLSETSKVSEPDSNGNVITTLFKVKGKKIEIPVSTNTPDEEFLLRCRRFKKERFSITWKDERNEALDIGGTSNDCFIEDGDNDRESETNTFSIIAMEYDGF